MSAPPRHPGWLWPLFVVTAFASTLCGIGGGLFAVPILHFLAGLPLKRAVATSMALVLVLSATSTAVELTRPDAALALAVAGPLVVGGFAGSRLGLAAARAIPTRRLKQVFVVVLALAGLRMLMVPAGSAPAGAGDAALDLGRSLLVGLVGLAGGFVAPILGVGGGLVVVPGLFLGVPGLAYLEARAAALCMSVAIALYVTTAHARAGALERGSALRYGTATLLGAVAGTLAVHQRGWADAARVLLALVLILSAARYAWSLRASSGRGAGPRELAARLLRALGADDFETAARLCDAGADPNAGPTDDLRPLHWVLDWSHTPERLDWLLSHGADPEARTGALGETALHVAVRRRRLDAVRRLAAAGADLDATTTGGMTAYRHAVRRGFGEIARALRELGARAVETPGDELARAALASDLARARELLEQDPALGRPATPEEARLLADLAGRDATEAVALLLDAGWDIGARGLDGGTPLHQTGWFGAPAVARLLIARGAPLDVRGDDHDSTPLGWVTHGSRYSGGAEERAAVYAEIAEALLAAGAPLPSAGEDWDREQHAVASDAVRAVLARWGWGG